MKLEYEQYANGMFKLHKNDFDDIALAVLKEYALGIVDSPRAVDINQIIKECLFLNVKSKYITADKSILGLIAFDEASLPCYDLSFNKMILELQAGDIVIDMLLSGKMMKYRRRFTLAHEASHWILHRTYHSPINQPFEFRKPYEESFAVNIEKKYKAIFTDTDREEWQANSLAAAILMPKVTFMEAAYESRFAKERANGKIVIDDPDEYTEFLEYLSSIFEVSRQAADIRLEQLDLYKRQ